MDIGTVIILIVVFLAVTFVGTDLLQQSASPQFIKMISGSMFYLAPIPLAGGGFLMIIGARRLAGRLIIGGIGLSGLASLMLVLF